MQFKSLIVWEQVSLVRYMKLQPDSFLLNLCNAAPLGLKYQNIVCVHDLAFEQKQVNWFTFLFKSWYQFLIPKIIQNSFHVFTVSSFSKKEIMTYYHTLASKITVIPNGLPLLPDVFNREIEGDYVVVLGGNNPRKNAQYVINQMQVLNRFGLQLVLIDDGSTMHNDMLSLRLNKSIIHKSYVKKQSYYNILKYSKALIYPSFYEGFGIPILESLCLLTPVICSDLSVFKESFGELPIYMDVSDANGLNEALQQLSFREISQLDVENLKQKFNFHSSVSLILETITQ